MSNADKPLPAKVCDVLAVAPRPLFLGEIEAALEFAYDKTEIMGVLVKLQAQGKVSSTLRPRQGPGPKVAEGDALVVAGQSIWLVC